MDKLKLQVLLDMADRVSAPLKTIGAGARSLGRDLGEAQQALRGLERQQAALAKFRGMQDNLRASKERLDAAKTAQQALVTELKKGGSAARAVAPEYRAANDAVAKLTQAYQRQLEQSKKMRATLGGLGITNAAADENRVRAAIEKTTQAIEKKRAALQRLERLEASSAKAAAIGGGMAAAGAVGVYAGKRTMDAGAAPARSFMAHEDAMLGVARQVPGARDELGKLTAVYSAIEDQVRELSTRIPLATTEIAEMFTAAARMEVPTDKLAGFVLMASEMATAFDAVPDEITESMGKVAKNFKIELTEIRGLADSINYLDDNAISKGGDIIDYLNRTSGVLSTVSMSAQNAAALGSTLLTLGERAETAGTATNAIFAKFAAATKGTKKFQSAVQEIGLASQAIETGMTTDAMGTVMQVMEAIRNAPEAKRMGIMVELVGMEHSDTLAKLVDKPEELKRQLELANSGNAAGSMSREASARNDTMSAQEKMFRNRMFNLSAVAGGSLKSAFIDVLAVVNPVLERLTTWTKANPALVGGILKAVIVLGAFMAATSAVLIPVGLLLAKFMLMRFMFAKLGMNMGLLSGAIRLVGAAVLNVGRALLLTPIGAIVAGIAVAALLIYKYWQPLAAFFSGIWTGFSDALAPAFSAIGNAIGPLRPVLDWLMGVLAGAWNWFTALLAPMQATQQQLQGISNMGQFLGQVLGTLVMGFLSIPQAFYQLGSDIITGFVNGLTNSLGFLKDAVVGVAASVANWFKEKLGINSPSRVFMEYGGWISEGAALGIQKGQGLAAAAAMGLAATTAAPMAMAGGQGLARPAASAAAAPAAGSSYQITIHAAPGMDPQAIAQAVQQALDQRERAKRSRTYSQLSDME